MSERTRRMVTDHKLGGLNDCLDVCVMDEPGAGGANQHYHVTAKLGERAWLVTEIKFQNGLIKDVGINGISNEALLAVIIDRLRGFQAGPFACDDNATALAAVEGALVVLQKRTRARIERGVEGTHEK